MSRFWDWRPQSRDDEAAAGTAIATPESALEGVEVYTATAMVFGKVATEGRRLSDILSANSTLPVRDAKSTSLINGVSGSEHEGWTAIPTDEILFCMPPEHTSPKQLRVHRQKHRVRIQTGQFEISGIAHVLPGIKLDPYVLRSRMRFLALTDAYARDMGADPPWERWANVVLVNTRPVRDLEAVVTIS